MPKIKPELDISEIQNRTVEAMKENASAEKKASEQEAAERETRKKEFLKENLPVLRKQISEGVSRAADEGKTEYCWRYATPDAFFYDSLMTAVIKYFPGFDFVALGTEGNGHWKGGSESGGGYVAPTKYWGEKRVSWNR